MVMVQTDSAKLTIFSDPQLSSKTLSVPRGNVICSENLTAANVYYINRGQVRLYVEGPNHSMRLIGIMGSGQWFGVEALAGVPTYQMHAVAIDNVVVTEVRIEHLLKRLAEQPLQLLELNRQLAQRLLLAGEEAGKLVFEDCNQRLIGALLRFAQSAAAAPHEDGVS